MKKAAVFWELEVDSLEKSAIVEDVAVVGADVGVGLVIAI